MFNVLRGASFFKITMFIFYFHFIIFSFYLFYLSLHVFLALTETGLLGEVRKPKCAMDVSAEHV